MSDNPKTDIVVRHPEEVAFEVIQRKAKLYTSSELVPKIYQGNTPGALANTVIALNLARRIGADELMVMQNLYIIQGRPSWSSTFIISALNSCGRFSPLRFSVKDIGQITVSGKAMRDTECRVVCTDLESGEILEGPPVSISMAAAEGWYGKNGSKWQTMPDLMLRYRAAAFFGRLYAPELLNGLQTVEESQDAPIRNVTPKEDIISQAKEVYGDTESPTTTEVEDLWSILIDWRASESIPEDAKNEIDDAAERKELDPAKLRALIDKVKAMAER